MGLDLPSQIGRRPAAIENTGPTKLEWISIFAERAHEYHLKELDLGLGIIRCECILKFQRLGYLL